MVWGGRSLTLAKVVLEHGSDTVGFEQYHPVLERVLTVLPLCCSVILSADRGFVSEASPEEKHGALMRWLQKQRWLWAIRVKSDLNVTLASSRTQVVEDLIPNPEQANLFPHVTGLDDIYCHLVTANVPTVAEP